MTDIASLKNVLKIPLVASRLDLKDDVLGIDIVDKHCVIKTKSEGRVIPLWDMEINVIKEVLADLIPEDFRIELHQEQGRNSTPNSRCSIVNTRRHLTFAFAYGDTSLEALIKCLNRVFLLVERNANGIECA